MLSSLPFVRGISNATTANVPCPVCTTPSAAFVAFDVVAASDLRVTGDIVSALLGIATKKTEAEKEAARMLYGITRGSPLLRLFPTFKCVTF